MEMRLLTRVFGVVEPENSIIIIKNMAEVDATGRYIDRSRRCAEGLDVPSRTLERGALYTNGVGVKSVCLFMRASQGLTARTSRGQIPRFSFYVVEDKED